MGRKIIIAVCCVVLFIFFFIGCSSKEKQELKTGDRAPEFVLYDIQGEQRRLSDYKGNVIVVRFWADWCRSCAEEMPIIESLYRKYKSRGVVIFAINTGQPKETVKAFMSSLNLTYIVLLDTDLTAAKKYGVIGLPTTFIIGRNGILREKILGDTEREAFERMVVALL
jgi:peroxiredoxin